MAKDISLKASPKVAKDRILKLPDPVSVEEALRRPSLSIRVPDGKDLTVCSFNAQPKGFRLARIASFENLHRLGFVSDTISEERAVQALRADERAHREAVRQDTRMVGSCPCGAAEGSLPHPFDGRF